VAAAINHDIRLRQRPTGMPVPGDFALTESPVPTPGPGQVLVRNLYMSVDPYMRGRMTDGPSYVAPFQIGEVLQGGAVGRVMASREGPFAEGDYVLSMYGWRDWFVSGGEGLMKIDVAARPADLDEDAWLRAHLGALGMPGLTAYVGLTKFGDLKADDRVLVSAAAGAVGSVACQIARNTGCNIVVGIAGTEEKCAWLRDALSLSGAIDYREARDLAAAIGDAMPGGIDLYFDNVGGHMLEAALENMRDGGRIAECGMISRYNSTEGAAAPRNLIKIVSKRLTVKGFIVSDHFDLMERFTRDMTGWIADGKMVWRETIYHGLAHAPEALIALFEGLNFGKMLVRLVED